MHSPPKKRAAGILLSITSLPSAFGIGDVGPEAFAFAEFLYRSKQTYWQILPLTPVDESQAFSPYSSVSSFAGNTLLISPEKLADEALLETKDLLPYRLPVTDKINYAEAFKVKNILFEKAFQNFQFNEQDDFELFCGKQRDWLDDFALYVILKEHFEGKPWYQWPENFRMRDTDSLRQFSASHAGELKKVKWLQYVFFKQWHALKDYCNRLNIRIMGDLPFYMSYDSADVWSHTEIFKLNEDGSMGGVAGVPPDYFNENGQLWGMPVYRWDVLKEKKFDWWIKRIRKNLELVDILRLDHFRAFSTFWEVPAKNKTAIKGKWKKAPGKELFRLLQKEFEGLPFVAEDLGDISEDVYQLRDRFGLPGMKVLQFAFGENMPESDHIPHNFTPDFFAYTGTHDNNTTRGWFQCEVKVPERKQLEQYAGYPVTEKNVNKVLLRMLYGSVAKTVIAPIQDVIGLDESARMNTPASAGENWVWRLVPDELGQREEDLLMQWVEFYGRSTK